jgi:hypothetical protein
VAIVVAALATGYWELKTPRAIPGGPAVFVDSLPPYADRKVTLKEREGTLGPLLADLAAQAKVELDVLLPGNANTITSETKLNLGGIGTYRFADALAVVRDSIKDNTAALIFEFEDERVVAGIHETVFDPIRAETRSYPIGDLLVGTKSWFSLPTHEQAVIKVEDLIVFSVQAEEWRENGGLLGSISDVGDRLLIRATPGMHRQIQQLLNSLREP